MGSAAGTCNVLEVLYDGSAAAARGGGVAGPRGREAARASWARPAPAALAVGLVTCVAIPFPVGAGGGWAQYTRTHRWVLSDQIGSGVLVVDENGGLVRHTRFQPFGAVDAETLPPTGDRRFYAGHPQQEETGLTYMKARWMDPESGTFLSVDPLHEKPWRTPIKNPQYLNGYSYAANNPITLTDPTGLEPSPPPGIEIIQVRGCGCYGSSGGGQMAGGVAPHPVSVAVVVGGGLVAAAYAYIANNYLTSSTSPGQSNVNQNSSNEDSDESSENEGSGEEEGSGKEFTPDQDAAIQLAKEAKAKGGIAQDEAESLVEQGAEVGLPTRGPESHPDRPNKGTHIHIGPIKHIPVR